MKNFSEKYNTFFVHIPKNAGTSINTALEIPPENRGHRLPSELEQLYVKEYTEANSIAVVRNPYDRVVSIYKYRKIKGYDRYLRKGYSFKEWLLHPKTPYVIGYMEWKNQITMLRTPKDQKGVSDWNVKYILRFENLEQEWQTLNENIFKGKLPQLQKLNQTNSTDYDSYYDNECKEYIKTHFETDLIGLSYEL